VVSVSQLMHLRLPCDTAAPRLAREALASLPTLAPVMQDAMMVVSELASNAVRHSGSSERDEIELLAEKVPCGVRIAVIDRGGSESQPARQDSPALEPGGLGLQVVEALSRRWGTKRNGQLKVWAELALPKHASGRSAPGVLH
jgi:serine/threonine-protein kinase RsbW